MHAFNIVFKAFVFVIGYTALFWLVRLHNLIPAYKLAEDFGSIPVLFGAGNIIFSVITAFIIQAQWTKWNKLTEATRGEINMLRQLFILAHHFPVNQRNEIRFRIYHYLQEYIKASNLKNYKTFKAFM